MIIVNMLVTGGAEFIGSTLVGKCNEKFRTNLTSLLLKGEI